MMMMNMTTKNHKQTKRHSSSVSNKNGFKVLQGCSGSDDEKLFQNLFIDLNLGTESDMESLGSHIKDSVIDEVILGGVEDFFFYFSQTTFRELVLGLRYYGTKTTSHF